MPEKDSTAWADRALLAGLLVFLAAWSWRRSGDVFTDFGHELYIPWQLAEGRVLYRDVVYFMGPLSQYFNALAFRLFGVSLTTLMVVNVLILAGLTAAIHALFSRALGRAAGLVLASVFLCVFGFAHYVRLGNYNYVTPYLHEQSHGVALGVLLLLLLERARRQPSGAAVAAAGVTLGLTFLTKAEAFVPALAATLAAGALVYAIRRPSPARAFSATGVFLGAALFPVASAFAFLAAQMPAAEALRGVAGNWVYILDRDLILANPYYGNNLGLAAFHEHLGENLAGIARLLGFAAVAMLLERALRSRGRDAAIAAGVLVAVALVLATDARTWVRIARPLPLICAVSAAALVWRFWRRPPTDARERQRDFILAIWAVFALASLGKMILRARLDHYGFALAMPGMLLFVALLIFVAPQALRARGWSGEPWRAASAAALLVGVGWLLTLSHLHYRAKTVPIGTGADRLYGLDPRLHHSGSYFSGALETLQAHVRPDETLAVFPDGSLLNFLLRLPNPTPYYLLTPWEMQAFGGEEAVFARIAPRAPDYFVLTRLNMSEYGPAHFGYDPAYGARIRLWVEQNYDVLADVGEEPESRKPWLRIYRRRPGQAASTQLPTLVDDRRVSQSQPIS